MRLFSFLNKNKQENAGDDGAYVSRDDDDAIAAKARSKRASSANEPAARRTRDGKAAVDPVLPEKKRARRRLVGAVALALAVAIGLPMILDAEPKPLASDIDIRIPSKEKAPPLALPTTVPAADALDGKEEIVEPGNAAEPAPRNVAVARDVAEVKLTSARVEPKPAARPEAKPEVKPEAKPAAKPDTARAIAILEDKAADKAPPQKYVLQVAALQSQEKVDELRSKLKEAGIASFTQKSGGLIRIRVGPFSKDDGEKIRAKLGKLGLSGSVVSN